jgi:hypothetical protein
LLLFWPFGGLPFDKRLLSTASTWAFHPFKRVVTLLSCIGCTQSKKCHNHEGNKLGRHSLSQATMNSGHPHQCLLASLIEREEKRVY